jgi:hypothetical protein
LNSDIVDACFENAEAEADPRQIWGTVGRICNGFFSHVQILGFKSCWLAHPGENQDFLVANQAKVKSDVQASREASNLARTSVHGGSVEMAVQGGFKKKVNGRVDVNFWVKVETKNGKTRRVLKHLGDDTAGGKSRFEGILADSEEPNLLAIEAKIKNRK